MNLLYTSTSYLPAVGGAQLHQHFLAREMNKTHSVKTVTQWDKNRSDWLRGTTINAPKNNKDYVVDGIPVHRFGISATDKLKLSPFVAAYYLCMGMSLSAISAILEQYLINEAGKASLIHNVRIGRAGLTAASLRAARRFRIPFVLTPVHHPKWVGWPYQQYINLYRKADGIFALTNSEKHTLAELGIQPEKIHVIGHGPIVSDTSNASAFTEKFGIASRFVLFLGQHYAYKGYQQLLESTQIVWQKHPDVRFVFAGPSINRSDKVFNAFDDHRIHRLGHISLQDKTNALSACTLLCVPSTQESFGGVYTESWMFGKPVIGCEIPAVSEVIENEVDGFLVQQQPEMIAHRIIDLLDNPDLASSMGESGRNKVSRLYSWSSIAKKAEEAYSHILNS